MQLSLDEEGLVFFVFGALTIKVHSDIGSILPCIVWNGARWQAICLTILLPIWCHSLLKANLPMTSSYYYLQTIYCINIYNIHKYLQHWHICPSQFDHYTMHVLYSMCWGDTQDAPANKYYEGKCTRTKM